MSELNIGQSVQLSDGRVATVRFVGQPLFAAGEWVGVELDDDTGKNDGSVQGERYFDCQMGRGMFLRPNAVRVIDKPAAPKPAATKKVSRPSSVGGPALGRRMSAVPDTAAGKRMSMNAASPSPATRGSRPSSLIRVCLLFHPYGHRTTNINVSHLPNLLRSNYLDHNQPHRPRELEPLPMPPERLQSHYRKHGQESGLIEHPWGLLLHQLHVPRDSHWQEEPELEIERLCLQVELQLVDLHLLPNQDFVLEQKG